MLVAIIGIVLCIIRRGKDLKKKIAVLILLLGVFFYMGVPYMADVIERDIETVTGIVTDERHIKRKIGEGFYSYRIVGESSEVTVYVSEKYKDNYNLSKGKVYTVEYFTESRAVKCVIRLDASVLMVNADSGGIYIWPKRLKHASNAWFHKDGMALLVPSHFYAILQ